MRLELRTRRLTLDPRMQETCERHLFHSLGRLADRIARVQLWMEDVNGPRGGRDLRCVLRVCPHRGGAITIEALAERAEVAVGEVFHRARTALLRALQLRRRGPMRRRPRMVLS